MHASACLHLPACPAPACFPNIGGGSSHCRSRPLLLPVACRGLAGPDSSSSSGSEDDSEGEDSDDEEGAKAAAAAAAGSGSEEEEGESGSEEDDDEEDEEAGFQGRQRLPASLGGNEEQEEPLDEADMAEWGVGALAANPEEPVSACLTDWLNQAASKFNQGRQLVLLATFVGSCICWLLHAQHAEPASLSCPSPAAPCRISRPHTRRSPCCPMPPPAWLLLTWTGST